MPRPSARRGRPVQPSAARIAPCSAAALRQAWQGQKSAPRRRAAEPGDAARHLPAVPSSAAFRQRARRQAALLPQVHPRAFHPGVREAGLPRRQEPALRMARVWLSGPETSPGELPEQRASAWALLPGLVLPWAQAGPKELRQAAGLPQAEVPLASPDASVLRTAPEVALSERAAAEASAAVLGHAAAVPRPEAASVPWVQQGAEEGPDGSRAAQPAGVAASGVTARQPAEARRVDAVVQPPGAVRPEAWAQQVEAAASGGRRAADPLALPSEAASVFRQGLALAGPAPPRAAAHFAHAMRSLRIASRSEPSWQAARNEGWSCGSTSPEGSLTKSGDEQLRVRPHCGGRSGRGPIYFCTQITSLQRRSLRIQT